MECKLIVSFHRRNSGLRLGCGEDFAWCLARCLASYRWKKRSWRVSFFCNLKTWEVEACHGEQLWHTLACSTLLSFQSDACLVPPGLEPRSMLLVPSTSPGLLGNNPPQIPMDDCTIPGYTWGNRLRECKTLVIQLVSDKRKVWF